MRETDAIDFAILTTLKANGPMTFEALIQEMTELTWNQIFNSVDRLSRRDDITVSRASRDYLLSVPAHHVPASLVS